MNYRQTGYIDNSIVPVIIAIILVVAFRGQITNWLGPWWARVNGWDIFIFVVSWIVAIGLFGFANLNSYERSDTSTDDLLRVENSGIAYGIVTLVISGTMGIFTVFYFNLWHLVFVAPFLFACVASGRRLMSPAMIATRQDNGFIVEFPGNKQRIEISSDEVPLVLTERRSGGAFGQPVKFEYCLNKGPVPINEFNSKMDAEHFGGYLSTFLGVPLEIGSTGL